MSYEPLVPAQQPGVYTEQASALDSGVDSTKETRPKSVRQPTGHPTDKVTAMGWGGGGLAIIINWLRARFGFEFIPEDIELIVLGGAIFSAYMTKERSKV